MPHIFISYAKKDTRDLALRLRDELAAIPGVTTWMDARLEAGESWALQIQSEIDRADYVVVLLSPDVNRPENEFQGRSFVLHEIDYAQQDRKRIIPVMAIWTKVPVQIAGIQYIDFSADTEGGIQKLVQEIGSRTEIVLPVTIASDFATAKVVNPTSKSSNTYLIAGGVTILAILTITALVFLSPQLPFEDQKTEVGEMKTPTLTDIAVTSAASVTMIASTSSQKTLATSPDGAVAHNSDWAPVEQEMNGITMVLVPAGQFQMGDASDSEIGDGGLQIFATPFWVSKNEVTNVQYKRCVDAGECSASGDNTYYTDPEYAATYADYPVVYVTWQQAAEFASWWGGRLLTEREWEYAARGPDNLKYPWGNDWKIDILVWDTSGISPVGSIPEGKSWVGALDMSGNVWEWTGSLYTPYPYVIEIAESTDANDDLRVLRGGSWVEGKSDYFRTNYRDYDTPDHAVNYRGFRIALSQ